MNIKAKFLNKYNNSIKDKNFSEILKGSSISFIAKVFNLGLGFIFSIIITRLYGAEVMGAYSIIASILTFALIFSLLGINTSIVRLIPEHIAKYSIFSAEKNYDKALIVVVFISFFVSILVYIFAEFIGSNFFKKELLIPLIIITSFFIIPQSIMSLSNQAIRGLKEIKTFAILQVLNPLSKIVILLTLYLFFSYTYAPIYSLLISNLLFAIILFFMVKKLFIRKKDENKSKNILKTKELLKISIPMFLTSAMLMLILEIDIMMLGIYSTLENVGIYAVVVKLAMLNLFVMGSINTIAGPKFSELYHSNKLDELEITAKKTTKLAVFSTIPILIISILLGKFLLGIFGEEFTEGYNALIILIVAQAISTCAGPEGYFLNMTGHQKAYNYILILSAGINTVLNFILIPTYGIEGAAFASMITKLIWMTITSIYIKKQFGFFIGYIPLISRIK